MDNLIKIQKWYDTNCNGEWEHSYGIEINTLDNPGWKVVINLQETKLEEKPFSKIKIDRSEYNWVECFAEKGNFRGYGGTCNLSEILEIFFNWAGLEDKS